MVLPLIRGWKIEHLTGLSPAGAELQEKIMELPERLLRKAEVFGETGGDKLRLTGALVPLPLILFLFTLPLVLLVRHESLPLITLTGLETLFLVALGSLVLGLDLILFGDVVTLGFVLAHWSRKSSLISPTA